MYLNVYTDTAGSTTLPYKSPYFYLTQRHVHLKYLHPFWTPVYYTIPPHERHGGKLGQARALKGYFVGYSYSRYLQPCYRVVAKYANGTYGRVRITKDVIFYMNISFRSELESDLPTEADFHSIPSLELAADEDNADALRRQLILAPASRRNLLRTSHLPLSSLLTLTM